MKKYLNSRLSVLYCALLFILFCACNKSELLNAKPQTSLTIPSTLEDFQSMMDVQAIMNQTPALGDASSDNYYISSSYFQTFTKQSQNVYIWNADIFQDASDNDWNTSYQQVLYANIVLDGLSKIQVNTSNEQAWKNIKGEALFYRSYAFFNIASLFAPFYDSTKANSVLGIPLPLHPDIKTPQSRANLSETYNQIFTDLYESKKLLFDDFSPNNKNRPSKAAVMGLLARIYLSMGDYKHADVYADSCLQLYSTLNDYNTVKMSTSNYTPYTYLNNNEVIYNSYQLNNAGPASSILILLTGWTNQISVDTLLYQSYGLNDLRRSIFYYAYSNGAINLNGGYGGNYNEFSGIATNEMYLIRSECYARAGNTADAMEDLNMLLEKRWKTGMFIPYSTVDASDALKQILAERRKELPFSGVRWTDLRRLNKEGHNITLKRIINGQTYYLQPNDSKYTMPIPPDVIELSGMQQNIR